MNAQHLISKKWGIFYYNWGCVIDQATEDSLQSLNLIVVRRLEFKYGKNWEERFFMEVDQEYQIETTVTELVDSQEYIQAYESIIIPRSEGGYPMLPLKDKSKYIVSVDYWHSQKGLIHIYKLLVDYKKREVKILKNYFAK